MFSVVWRVDAYPEPLDGYRHAHFGRRRYYALLLAVRRARETVRVFRTGLRGPHARQLCQTWGRGLGEYGTVMVGVKGEGWSKRVNT